MVSDFSAPNLKSVRIVGCGGRVRVSGGHLCAMHRSTDRGDSRDLEPTVLYFLCGENTAVGSVALTVHRTVIHYHLTLRVIRPRAHNPIVISLNLYSILRKEKHPSCDECFLFWLRRKDLNQRPSGYEPDELPTALLRDIY